MRRLTPSKSPNSSAMTKRFLSMSSIWSRNAAWRCAALLNAFGCESGALKPRQRVFCGGRTTLELGHVVERHISPSVLGGQPQDPVSSSITGSQPDKAALHARTADAFKHAEPRGLRHTAAIDPPRAGHASVHRTADEPTYPMTHRALLAVRADASPRHSCRLGVSTT